jgi:hypothetical protein
MVIFMQEPIERHPIDRRDEVARQAAMYAAQVMTWAACGFLGFVLGAIALAWAYLKLTSG